MKRWKQYLSVMTAAAVVISGPAVPMSQVFAADAQMVTDADLNDTTVAEPAAWGATPNDEQLWYMKQGTAAFCHFGPNTFNNVEWGEKYGETAPVNLFTLTKDFDAESLVKAVKEAGFSRLILTAKHHDGFCLWSSEYTDYDIASTNYKNGKGDILEEISAQMLVAISAVNELGGELSAFQIMPRLFYPMLLLVSSVLAILWNRNEK